MPITVTLDPARHDLDAIHTILAGTYWSPDIRREVVAEALRNSITAVAADGAALVPRHAGRRGALREVRLWPHSAFAHLDGEAGAEGSLAGRVLTRAGLPTSPQAATRARRSPGAGR